MLTSIDFPVKPDESHYKQYSSYLNKASTKKVKDLDSGTKLTFENINELNINDVFKISTGDTERMSIDANGHVTMPHQSAFLCQASGQTNLSTNATTTIGFSAIFDQNSDSGLIYA